tara:strand:+ start:97 stop:999 length:903 start_codon:yes stop_codon:yes gene_type:complete
MALEVTENTAAQVTQYPDVSAPVSGTATFHNAQGVADSTPAVTVDVIGTGGAAVVQSVQSQTQLHVVDATGITAGRQYWLANDDAGWGAAVLVSEVDGVSITLESPPPGVLTNADSKLVGLRLSVTLSASTDTNDRGLNNRVEWVVLGVDGVTRHYRTIVDVVKTPWPDSVAPQAAARFLAMSFPGYATGLDAGHYVELARRASQRVRNILRADGNYPHMVGDRSVFESAGLAALRLECATADALIPAGFDPSQYLSDQEQVLRRLLAEAVANNWIDRNDDGQVDAGEVSPMFTMRVVRR